MEIEAGEKSADKKLNSFVAITVLIVSVFLAISKLRTTTSCAEWVREEPNSTSTCGTSTRAERIKLHGDENAIGAATLCRRGMRRPRRPEAHVLKNRSPNTRRNRTSWRTRRGARRAIQDAGISARPVRHHEDGILSITLALTAVAADRDLLVAGGGGGCLRAWIFMVSRASLNGRFTPNFWRGWVGTWRLERRQKRRAGFLPAPLYF